MTRLFGSVKRAVHALGKFTVTVVDWVGNSDSLRFTLSCDDWLAVLRAAISAGLTGGIVYMLQHLGPKIAEGNLEVGDVLLFTSVATAFTLIKKWISSYNS